MDANTEGLCKACGSICQGPDSRECRENIIILQGRKIEALEQDIKKRVWAMHELIWNHVLYGDDGEMQCTTCKRDYKRAVLSHVYEWEKADGMEAMRQMHTGEWAAHDHDPGRLF